MRLEGDVEDIEGKEPIGFYGYLIWAKKFMSCTQQNNVRATGENNISIRIYNCWWLYHFDGWCCNIFFNSDSFSIFNVVPQHTFCFKNDVLKWLMEIVPGCRNVQVYKLMNCRYIEGANVKIPNQPAIFAQDDFHRVRDTASSSNRSFFHVQENVPTLKCSTKWFNLRIDAA